METSYIASTHGRFFGNNTSVIIRKVANGYTLNIDETEFVFTSISEVYKKMCSIFAEKSEA